MQGEIIQSKAWPIISENNLNNLLDNFRGEILQRPPLISSVHVKGERAYKKARRGEKFDLTPKKITINFGDNKSNLLNHNLNIDLWPNDVCPPIPAFNTLSL